MVKGFECFRCGVCCVKFQVRLNSDEAAELARNLNLSLPDFITEYTDPRWPGADTYLIKHHHGACVFLERTGGLLTGCRVHGFRPQSCQDWQAGPDKAECRQGRAELLKKIKDHFSSEG